MTVVFEAEAEEQLFDLAEIIDDLNITGAGERWINRFLDFIESFAKEDVTYALCKDHRLAELNYSCMTYNHTWVVAFKFIDNEMRIYEILNGSLLK